MNCFFCGKKLYYNPSVRSDSSGDVTCAVFDGRHEVFSDKVYHVTLICLSGKLVRINPEGKIITSRMGFSLFPSTGILINILKRLTESGTKFEGVSIE